MGPGSGPRGRSTLSGQKGPTVKAGQGPLWPSADYRIQETKDMAFKNSVGPIKPSNQMKEVVTSQAASGTRIGSKCFFNQDVGQVKLVQWEETVNALVGGRRKLR